MIAATQGFSLTVSDEIPRNAMGKVDRTRLRDAVLAVTRVGAVPLRP